jgi:outer membrane protein OmpA-like peptidoglycan-associated protein
MCTPTKINGVLLILVSFFVPLCGITQSAINKDAIPSLKIYNEKSINTANLESSPAFVGDKIGYVFTGNKIKILGKEIAEPYYELGYSIVNQDNSLQGKQIYNKRINSDLHEGAMSYDAHQNKLFFTRVHKETRKIKGKDSDTLYLMIMSADLNVAKPVVTPINLNVENYSVCHPALTSDGKTMIYASDKTGGKGKSDLYTAYFNGEEWSGIINLGSNINSDAREMFPNILNDSILIFASDRPGGFGGFDMYVSVLRNGSWDTPEILPSPLNSPFDDLGLIVRENGKSGYFASNRPGGKGEDDIYRFETSIPLFSAEPVLMATSTVTILDKLTLEGIGFAKITLTPLDIDINNFTLSSYNVDMLSGRDPGDLILKLTPKKGKSYPEITTDSFGITTFQLKKAQKYLIKTSAPGYAETSLIYDYSIFGSAFNMVLEPEGEEDMTEVGGPAPEVKDHVDPKTVDIPLEAGTVLVFDNIYYEYNSSVILRGAAVELDALARMMLLNPEVKVRLESHTDSRGAAPYNLQLSLDRATAARQYLTNIGVDEDRITIKGYGESKLRNECKDNVPCSESKHKYNRRTEVIIEK